MTSITISSNAPAGSRITGIAISLLEHTFNLIREYRQRRAGIAALRTMSQHQLKDIGIYPSDSSAVPVYEVDATTMAMLMSLR